MSAGTTNFSNYWLDQVADEIITRYPKGEVVVSSGHSPSGTYHIGTTREMMTASAIVWAIRARGREAKHIDFVDDFDVLRKIPSDLPEALQSELGKPLYLANGPDKGTSYGEYFYRNLAKAASDIGFAADETFFASTTYAKEHRYTQAITQALDNLPKIRQIIEEVSHRKLVENWGPVQILSEHNRLNAWKYTGHDTERQMVSYKTEDGTEGEISYAEGRVKLDWRLDWPARWAIWGVQVEPFGRDHATKGGSYDTGVALVKQIFGGEAPVPVPYGFINPTGQTKKFSKSAGGVITPADVMEVMPAEIIRYFVVRSRPEKELTFDVGVGMLNLIDEFAAAQSDPEHPFRDAYKFAVDGNTEQIISSVPFKHLVQVYQAAQGDEQRTLEVLERTGWKPANDSEKGVLFAELKFVKNWLDKYAPDDVKFQIQEKLPDTKLSDGQKQFLTELADTVSDEKGEIEGLRMHELIYAAKDAADLEPKEAFQALYRVILGKDYGPKAGWFLASLDKEWLAERLRLQK